MSIDNKPSRCQNRQINKEILKYEFPKTKPLLVPRSDSAINKKRPPQTAADLSKIKLKTPT